MRISLTGNKLTFETALGSGGAILKDRDLFDFYIDTVKPLDRNTERRLQKQLRKWVKKNVVEPSDCSIHTDLCAQ